MVEKYLGPARTFCATKFEGVVDDLDSSMDVEVMEGAEVEGWARRQTSQVE